MANIDPKILAQMMGGANSQPQFDPNTLKFLANANSPIPTNRQLVPPATTATDTSGLEFFNEPVDWGDDRSVADPTQTNVSSGTPPGQYPPERIAQHAAGDSLYNAAFDSSEAAYLAQNPAMSPQLANKLFPQPNVGSIMARTNENAPDYPSDISTGGGLYNAPPTEGNVSFQDPSALSAPPSIQQMTNPLGADTSSLGPVSNEFQPPPVLGPPAVYNPQDEALALATQYMAGKEPVQKSGSYWGGGAGDRPDIAMNPNATSMNQMGLEGPVAGVPRADLQSLVPKPPGSAMSAQDAAAMLAGQKVTTPSQEILPEKATPKPTGEGTTGDSSVVVPPVVDPKKEAKDKAEQAGVQSTKTSIDAGKPSSGGGIGTQIGASTPSGVTTSPIASSGGVNIAGLYDDTQGGQGLAGTSDITYTPTKVADEKEKGGFFKGIMPGGDKWGAGQDFGKLMTSPRMRTAMMEAAKALDPTGFGGKLATSMGPIMAGEFEDDYMSRILAGEDPGKIGKDYTGVLSMDQMNNARAEVIKIAEQRRKQQATDETEDPAQKLYRQMAGEAYKGGVALSVADKNYYGKLHSAIASSGSANNKQITTQAFKQLNDVADKLPVGVYTKDADGNIVMDEDKWSDFLLSDHKPITPTEIDAFIGALEELERLGVPTMGFENSLDNMKKLRANLSPLASQTIQEQTKKEYKDGDIMEKDGRKYKRREGNWYPV